MPSDEVLAKLRGAKAKVAATFSRGDITAALTAQPHPDPLAGVESTGDLEADAKAELDALGKGLSGASREWAAKFAQMNDSEFWIALCFKDRAAKERFLRVLHLFELGDKYLDGHKVAAILGVNIDDE